MGTLGALSITSECATGMIRTSLTAVPRRQVFLFVKIPGLAAGDASGFAEYVRRATGSPKVPSLAGQNMTTCLDGQGYESYAAYRSALRRAQELSPNFAGQRAWWPLGCAGWPAPVTNPPAPLPAGQTSSKRV
ncbi:hypothetical protein ABZ907_37785 [Nonomuraea wenchangensis]